MPTPEEPNKEPKAVEPPTKPKSKKSQSVHDYIHPPAYSQRHVVSLKGVSQWTDTEREAHFKHNRILQEGFLARDAEGVVNDAKLCQEDWLTDIACPSVEASLALHVAGNLVVSYTVDEEDLNAKTSEIMNNLTQNASEIRQLRAAIKDKMQTKEVEKAIEKGALERYAAAAFVEKRFAASLAKKRFAEKYPEEDINNPKNKKKLEKLEAENKKILEDLKDVNSLFADFVAKRFAEKYPGEDIKDPKNKKILEGLKDDNILFAAFIAKRFAEKYPKEDINDPKNKKKLKALEVENKKILEGLKEGNILFAVFVVKRFAEKYPEEDINDPKNKEKLEALEVESKKILEDFKDINKPENKEILEAFGRIQRDVEQKKITDKIIAAYVDEAIHNNKDTFELTEKQPKKKGENTDSVYLGAAGSGKSTIMRQEMTGAKKDMVVLATDSYRGVTLPAFEAREAETKTDQVFIRTQDTAYMIKDLVRDKLQTLEERPDILVDGVTLEGWHRKLLAGNQETNSVIAALDDASLIAIRVFNRGNDKNAGPADRGRHMNTTGVVEGHANASESWLSGVPEGIVTKVYGTNVSSGGTPELIGRVDARKGQESIDVLNLSTLATFLGKANLNSEATDKAYLYVDPNKTSHQFTANPRYQAEQILEAARAVKMGRAKKPSYTLNLFAEDGKTIFATIKEKEGKLELVVKDPDAYKAALKGPAKEILTELTQRVIFKETLKDAEDRAFNFGDKKAPLAIAAALKTAEAVKTVETVPPQKVLQFGAAEAHKAITKATTDAPAPTSTKPNKPKWV